MNLIYHPPAVSIACKPGAPLSYSPAPYSNMKMFLNKTTEQYVLVNPDRSIASVLRELTEKDYAHWKEHVFFWEKPTPHWNKDDYLVAVHPYMHKHVQQKYSQLFLKDQYPKPAHHFKEELVQAVLHRLLS